MTGPLCAVVVAACLGTAVHASSAQAPAGLAARALSDTAFSWIHRSTRGFRVSFLADSYAAQHQDSLLARLSPAARHAEALLHVRPLASPIDVFFIESREQMSQLIGVRATGFAHASARAVFLVTNPEWRAFERHEIMHVVVDQAWGTAAPGNDWLVEGLAQAADGRCGRYSNAGVLLSLVTTHGWIPFASVLGAFRSQSDLRAYLQAAAFVDHLLRRFGPDPLKALWTQGTTMESTAAGQPLAALEREWRAGLDVPSRPGPEELASIEAKGCG